MKQLIFKDSIEDRSQEIDTKMIKENIENSDEILNTADLLLDNNFIFTRTWDMEPSHHPYKNDPIDWLENPNNDDEWTFMLNRFNYIEYLIMATIITDDVKYMEHAKFLIMNWIEQHPEIIFDNSTRTLDTGMRINAWVDAIVYFCKYDLVSDEEFIAVENSIIAQILYMKENYIPKYTLSNWGSIQTASIIKILPLLSDFEEKSKIYHWAIEEFEKQMKLQVYDDGLHWEQSTMYHAEVLHYSLKIIEDNNYIMPNEIKDILYKMAEALLYQMTPTRSFEAFGDSDISNLISLLNLCAIKFKEGKFKVENDPITNMDNLYELTSEQINFYNNLSSHLPKQYNFDGYDSGMFTTRNDWTKNSNFTLFTNGTMGSGHAHADNNHVSIYYDGKPIVVDSGRYTYREDAEERLYLKTSQAHSGIVIDGIAASIPNGSWTFETYLKPLGNRVKHKESFHYYEGTTLSTLTPHFYTHTRKVFIYDQGIWFVVDDIRSQGNHSIQTYFNIEPNVHMESKNNELILNNLKFISLDEKMEINKSIYSPKYNQLSENKQIELNSTFTDKSITKKLFIDKNYEYKKVEILRDKKEPISDDLGVAIKVSLTSEHSITFIVINDELYDGRKNLYCEGVAFHAKALAIEERNENKQVHVLET